MAAYDENSDSSRVLNLPTEIIQIILDYVTETKDLLNLNLCSRALQQFIGPIIWANVRLTPAARASDNTNDASPSWRKGRKRHYYYGKCETFCNRWSYTSKHTCHRCFMNLNSDSLKDIKGGLEGYMQRFQFVRKLVVNISEIRSDDDAAANLCVWFLKNIAPNSMMGIRLLEIKFGYPSSYSILNMISHLLASFQNTDVDQNITIVVSDLQSVSTNSYPRLLFDNLKLLTIMSVKNRAFIELVQRHGIDNRLSPNLERLDFISFESAVPDQMTDISELVTIIEPCTNLKSAKLVMHLTNNKNVDLLSRVEEFTYMNLNEITQTFDDNVVSICSNIKKLEINLGISRFKRYKFPNLKSLSLIGAFFDEGGDTSGYQEITEIFRLAPIAQLQCDLVPIWFVSNLFDSTIRHSLQSLILDIKGIPGRYRHNTDEYLTYMSKILGYGVNLRFLIIGIMNLHEDALVKLILLVIEKCKHVNQLYFTQKPYRPSETLNHLFTPPDHWPFIQKLNTDFLYDEHLKEMHTGIPSVVKVDLETFKSVNSN